MIQFVCLFTAGSDPVSLFVDPVCLFVYSM